MLISVIFAWLTTVLTAAVCFKFIARISGSKQLNAFFHKIHIPLGWMLLASALLHGIFAGNPSFATLSDFTFAPLLFTLNWGSGCIVFAIVLALTYLLRKKLKRLWMPLHRAATLAMVLCLVLHIINTGIQLPSLLYSAMLPDASQSDDSTAPQTQENAPETEALAHDNTPETTPETAIATTDETTAQADAETASPSSDMTFSGAVLADGVYNGSAQGYGGTIKVEVTVEGGEVADIEVVSQSETERFFEQAKKILDTILGAQSLEVDAVSGATYSSAGLINAVYDALSGAVTSGTLDVNEIDLSGIRRHGGH